MCLIVCDLLLLIRVVHSGWIGVVGVGGVV